MIKYKTYIKATFFILILVGLFGFVNYRNATRKITDIQVEFEKGDNLFITYETVNKLLTQTLAQSENQTKESIILKVLEKTVSENDMIELAEVYLTVDGTLKTKVLQRKPIARVYVNNKAYYLDSSGNKMPLSKEYSARVPIVTGVKSDKDLKLVYKMCNTVLNDEFMNKQIIGINVINNELELKTRMGNQLILFGDLSKSNSKVSKLKAFYQKVIKNNTLKSYHKIDLRFNKQVVCTKVQ